MRFNLLAAGLRSVFLLGFSVAATAQTPRSAEVRLLSTSEIKDLLVGKTLDSGVDENFTKEGYYIRISDNAELMGTYKIRKRQVCIWKNVPQAECRYVGYAPNGHYYWYTVPDMKLLWRIK